MVPEWISDRKNEKTLNQSDAEWHNQSKPDFTNNMDSTHDSYSPKSKRKTNANE